MSQSIQHPLWNMEQCDAWACMSSSGTGLLEFSDEEAAGWILKCRDMVPWTSFSIHETFPFLKTFFTVEPEGSLGSQKWFYGITAKLLNLYWFVKMFFTLRFFFCAKSSKRSFIFKSAGASSISCASRSVSGGVHFNTDICSLSLSQFLMLWSGCQHQEIIQWLAISFFHILHVVHLLHSPLACSRTSDLFMKFIKCSI